MNSWKEYADKSTMELIEIFQCLSKTQEERDPAFHHLVHRFREDLLKYCEIRCKHFGQSTDVAENLAFKVFECYAKNPGFDPQIAKSKNIDDSFLLYLSGIARNEFTNLYRIQKRKDEGKWSDGSETIVTTLPDLPPNASPKMMVIHQVLDSLSYRHRVIYLTYKLYEKAECNLPRKLLQELRDHLGGISQTTVRIYKKEAVDKIETALMGFKISQT